MHKYCIFAVLVLSVALLSGAEACAANNSHYISDTLPTTMSAGITYTATVTMQNTGDTTWTDGIGATQYDFGAWDGLSPGPNKTWSAPRALIGGTVVPDATHTFTLAITAPGTNGTYDTEWGMVQEDVQWFGEIVHKTITVTGGISPVTALKAKPAPRLMVYDSGEIAGNATSHTIISAIPETYHNIKLYVFERDKVRYAVGDSRGGYQPWSAPGEFDVFRK
ncbi:MAG: NBR1-Ig-like domain-containing protein [Armatimonadota bacterium]|nr:NBR1-Ig-like domain-containing protein [Armatimonadota bacterium]